MAICEVCGNDYDKAFQVTKGGETHTFDSFECAIRCPRTRRSQIGSLFARQDTKIAKIGRLDFSHDHGSAVKERLFTSQRRNPTNRPATIVQSVTG